MLNQFFERHSQNHKAPLMTLSIGTPTSQKRKIMPMLHDREKIKALREKLGLSINELGRRAGITGPSMHAIETGETKNLRAKTLMGIAAALGVRVQDIIRTPPRGSKDNGDLFTEAISAFSQLDDRNKLAMIAAMSSLAAQQKKK